MEGTILVVAINFFSDSNFSRERHWPRGSCLLSQTVMLLSGGGQIMTQNFPYGCTFATFFGYQVSP